MKKRIAIFLSAVFLITSLIPLQVFAGGDNGLTNALKSVKSKFEIPVSYTEFNYNVNTEGKKQIWNLSWNGKDGADGSINVRVDDQGTILNYYSYKQSDYTNAKRFPKLSKQEAQVKAEEFINKVDPTLLKQLKYTDNGFIPSLNDIAYNFSYIRQVNGIPFYSNNLNIDINRQTGDVQNYNINWSDDLVFPKADNAITLEKAQTNYKQKLGLVLSYNSTYDNQGIKTYPAYVPKYTNSFIDALTGEKVEMDGNYYGPYYGGMKGMGGYAMAASMPNSNIQSTDKKEDAPLTPDEIKAVEKVSKLLTQDEAESAARKIDVLELTSDYKVGYANLSKGWPNPDDFGWDLNFSKDEGTNGIDNRSVNVRINAKTAEVLSFNTYYPYKEGAVPTIDEAASRAAVEEFVKKFNPSKYSECQFDSNFKTNYGPVPLNKLPSNYNFNYVRVVNGVVFPGNSINIGFDTVSGKITNYNLNWSDIKFPSVSNIIKIEDAYDSFFSKVGLELQYKTTMPEEIRIKMAAGMGISTAVPEVKLVYAEKQSIPAIIDANTGNVLDSSGQPYKEVKPIKYSDISGNFAEKQITTLAEFNIALDGTEFKPNENIKQKDFFRLLSKTIGYYSPIQIINKDNDLDELYKYMISQGILLPEEKAPESNLTKEDAVKFIIRSLKYDKVAAIKGIFKCDFKDLDKINPDLVGAVAIAKGLGIVNGSSMGYFNPKSEITRAETAAIIYNYLQI